MSLNSWSSTEQYEDTIPYLYNMLGLEPKIQLRDLKDHTNRIQILSHLMKACSFLDKCSQVVKKQHPRIWNRNMFFKPYTHEGEPENSPTIMAASSLSDVSKEEELYDCLVLPIHGKNCILEYVHRGHGSYFKAPIFFQTSLKKLSEEVNKSHGTEAYFMGANKKILLVCDYHVERCMTELARNRNLYHFATNHVLYGSIQNRMGYFSTNKISETLQGLIWHNWSNQATVQSLLESLRVNYHDYQNIHIITMPHFEQYCTYVLSHQKYTHNARFLAHMHVS